MEESMSNGVKLKEASKNSEADTQEAPTTFTVRIGQLGRKLKEIIVPAGTTLRDLVNAQHLEGTEIRLRGAQMPNDTLLEEGDLILSVPDAVVGGQAGSLLN